MGTSQRISPGVPGESNWGSLNRAITQIAKTVEKEREEGQDDPQSESDGTNEQTAQNQTQNLQSTRYSKLVARRNNHIKSAYNNLVKTGGGVGRISSGRSKSMGRAGLKSSKKLTVFFTSVSEVGLKTALNQIGFDLTGKNVQDIIDFLLVYSSDTSAGMDDTAANKASCEVLNEIAQGANNDLNAFEQVIKKLATGNELSNLVCRFLGYYIFEHLSQRFQEKITQYKGQGISVETFKIIKDDIIGQVERLNKQRPVSQINWKSEEGKTTIENIFRSIINILCDES